MRPGTDRYTHIITHAIRIGQAILAPAANSRERTLTRHCRKLIRAAGRGCDAGELARRELKPFCTFGDDDDSEVFPGCDCGNRVVRPCFRNSQPVNN